YTDALPPGVEAGLEASDFFRPPQLVYPFGAHVAVVEIDRDTGRVRLRDFVSVDDCGVRISPLQVAGQLHGGLAQGIAQALLEELIFGEDGQLVTGTLMDYAVPHADDLPSFVTDQTVTPTPFNQMGAKGIGEAATIGSTPAIVNAVVGALRPFRVRHLDMPLRPDNVLVLMTSVINGLSLSGTNRYTAAAKSPLTGGYGESEAGGWWGPELRAAGWEGVVVRGRAESPAYLWLKDGQVEIRDARPYWGKLSGEAQYGLEQELGSKRIRGLPTGIA